VWRSVAGSPCYRSIGAANVGLAVAGEDTLLVPTIGDAGTGTLAELVRATEQAVRRARAGALSATDSRPAAIILSNLGMYRVEAFQAIIDPEQTAILATGRVSEQVVALEGGIHVVPRLQATLTIDHRVADGALAARFRGHGRQPVARNLCDRFLFTLRPGAGRLVERDGTRHRQADLPGSDLGRRRRRGSSR